MNWEGKAEVEFFIEVRTRKCALYRSMCTSEYPYGRGERGLVINTRESVYVDGKYEIVHDFCGDYRNPGSAM
jgi:hypothetical protein